MGKRGLYQKIAGETQSDAKKIQMALLWVLNYSDGQHSLLDIAIKSGIEFLNIKKAADALFECNLLKEELSE